MKYQENDVAESIVNIEVEQPIDKNIEANQKNQVRTINIEDHLEEIKRRDQLIEELKL